MSATVVKITFPEFKKFLEAAPDRGRVADCWTVQSDDPTFNNHMGAGGDETDELLSRISDYKTMEEGYYGDVGADYIYVLHPNDDLAGKWDDAIEKLLPRTEGEEASDTWRKDIEPLIPELRADQLDDFTYNDGKSSDFLVFACDVQDIVDGQWSTLHANRS